MSTSNIISQFSIPVVGYFVVFEARDGVRVYGFSETEGILIANGTDPQHFNGQRIQSLDDVVAMAGPLSEEEALLAVTALAEFL